MLNFNDYDLSNISYAELKKNTKACFSLVFEIVMWSYAEIEMKIKSYFGICCIVVWGCFFLFFLRKYRKSVSPSEQKKPESFVESTIDVLHPPNGTP